MGILTKRGNASVKSMLKVYKLEKDYDAYIKHSQAQEKAQMGKDEEDLEVEGPIV